ncbi:hypothetical protein QZH41_003916 [Actinostola sp. cb2023]|nr:hypothetical protein QZH41_003916 [Actinostola sp. cb2023]
MYGESLRMALTSLFEEYATDIAVKKIAPAENSQRNESLNNTIGSNNLKIRYYGGSESSDFRVACGVAQKNIGHSYVSKTLESINIQPGLQCESHGKSFVDQLQDMNVYFADSRSIVRYLKKHPPPNVEMPSKENLSTLFNTLMNEEFDAHDALEDSKALCKLFLSRSSPLQLSRELLVNECNSISAEDAFRDIKLLDQSNDLVRSYQGNLYDHFNDQGPVKLGIIKKMTIQGISYQHLNRVYQQYGKIGLYAVLALPPSTSPTTSRPTARISKTSRIIASIIYHFETQ